ncbi:hypothetical protein K8R14_00515 [bacterium]|nr:hypothetical protein [bacterium]
METEILKRLINKLRKKTMKNKTMLIIACLVIIIATLVAWSLLGEDIVSTTKEQMEELETTDDLNKDVGNEQGSGITEEEGLIAYYPFDGDAKDYSGEGENATNYGTAYVEGKEGKALGFENRDNYVYAPVDINPASMPQMTMTAWVKAREGSIIVRQVIGNQGDNDDYNRSMGTDFRGGGKGWSCFAGTGKVLGYEPVVADKWTFIATVYNQTAGTVKLFIDGSIYEKEGILADNGNDHILIGAEGVVVEEQSHHFNGVVDEVKIYDYALSDTELNSLYKTGTAKLESE